MLLGDILHSRSLTTTGLSPSTVALSKAVRIQERFLTVRSDGSPTKGAPQPQLRNPCQVSHATGLASSDFARHYSRNHYCFLFLPVLRCFTSRRSLHTPYRFRRG